MSLLTLFGCSPEEAVVTGGGPNAAAGRANPDVKAEDISDGGTGLTIPDKPPKRTVAKRSTGGGGNPHPVAPAASGSRDTSRPPSRAHVAPVVPVTTTLRAPVVRQGAPVAVAPPPSAPSVVDTRPSPPCGAEIIIRVGSQLESIHPDFPPVYVSASGSRYVVYRVKPYTSWSQEAVNRERLIYEQLGGSLSQWIGEAYTVEGPPECVSPPITVVRSMGDRTLSDVYIARGPVNPLLTEGIAITEAELAALAASAVEGLRDIHAQGIVHGSLVIYRIVLTNDPTRRVAFKHLRRASSFQTNDSPPRHYAEGTIPPTVIPDAEKYAASPFELAHSSPSRRDDMYRLAAALFYALGDNLRLPYDSPTDQEIAAKLDWQTRLAESTVFNEFYAAATNMAFDETPDYAHWIERFTERANQVPPAPALGAEVPGVDVRVVVAFQAELVRYATERSALTPGVDICPPAEVWLASGERIRLDPNGPRTRGVTARVFPSTDPAGRFAIRVTRDGDDWGETAREQAIKSATGDLGGVTVPMYPLDPNGPVRNVGPECLMRITVTDFAGNSNLDGFNLFPQYGALPVTIRQVAAIAVRLIEMVRAVHAVGMVHGDIRNHNVVVADIGTPGTMKLVDFGRTIPFIDPSTGRHILPVVLPNRWFIDPTHLSPFELEGSLLSRRDDMYRVSELLFRMIDSASVPSWRGNSDTVAQQKRDWRINDSFGSVFNEFHAEMLSLEFSQQPNYEQWITRFRQI